jgi:hypothetical protein
MPKAPCRFLGSEISRALKAMENSGYEVDFVLIAADGAITIHPRTNPGLDPALRAEVAVAA